MLRNPHLVSPRGRGSRSLWRVYMDLPERCTQTGAPVCVRATRTGRQDGHGWHWVNAAQPSPNLFRLWNPHLASPCLPCRHRQAMGEGFSVPRQEELHIAALHPAVLDVNAHGIGQANTRTLFQRHVLHPEMTVIIIQSEVRISMVILSATYPFGEVAASLFRGRQNAVR